MDGVKPDRVYIPPRYRVTFHDDPLVEIHVRKKGRWDHWRTATQINLVQRVISVAREKIARAMDGVT